MTPRRGHFILHTSVKPPVTAGDYVLRSEQTGMPFDVHTTRTHVRVSSPRFQMPSDQILSTFPPANADGAFGDRLPQIVLKRRTLPWERNPAGESGVSDTPWLALVVVAEGEAELSTPKPVGQCVTVGTDLLDPDDTDTDQAVYLGVTQSVLTKIFPTQQDLQLLAHVREVDVEDTELAGGDDDGWLAVVLANRLPVFDDVNDQPVRYLACLVNLEGQLDALPEPSTPVDRFNFALAEDYRYLAESNAQPDTWTTGGDPRLRFLENGPMLASPQADGGDSATTSGRAISDSSLPSYGAALNGETDARSSAWSVSNTTARITDAALSSDPVGRVRDTMGIGFRLPIEAFVPENVYRFPVLAHWSFTTSEGANFESLMQNLDVGILGTQLAPAPAAPPRPEGSRVLATGHIQLDHTTRRGDSTSAWYRGPFVPHPSTRGATPDERLALAHAADQLRAVVPDGYEDLALASAFEIGRLLALSQLSVTADLVRYRNEQFGAARAKEMVKRYVPLDLGTRVEEVTDLSHLVSTMFLDRLAADPVRVAGPRRPVADPGRPIVELSGLSQSRLDEVIAGGLGIDIAEVRKKAEVVGVVAALSDTAVRVQRDTKFGAAEIAKLQQSLSVEVRRLANIAGVGEVPFDVPSAAAESTQREQSGDALDELLEGLESEPEPEGEGD